MDRLQKKCLIGTASAHALLILILIVGPGFFKSTPKVDDKTPVLIAIPPIFTDQLLNSGQPTPTQPPPQPKPLPPQPKPEVTPTPPEPKPTPEPPKPVVKQEEPDQPDQPDKPSPDAVVPVKPVKHKPHVIKVDTSHPIKRTIKQTDNTDAEADAKEERHRRDALHHALVSAQNNIEKNSSTATEVTMPGTSSVSYANFAQAVKSIYDREWKAPDDASNDDANTVVKVTIASDGTVVSSRIVTPSGDAKVDASVQRALDNVTYIGPFPEGATEKTRTFTINFNLQSKRQNG